MRRICAIGLGAAISVAAADAAVAQGKPLEGDELRQAVSGQTVHMRIAAGIEVPIAYRADGTMHGRVRALVAAIAGGEPRSDSGRWWIAGDRLCQQWRRWMDGKQYCYRLQRNGASVTWRRDDGRSGTARLGG